MEIRGYDLVAIHPGSPAGVPEQQLDLEILVAFVRSSGFTVLVLDSALNRLDGAGLLERTADARPLLVYWHLPSRTELTALRSLSRVRPEDTLSVAGGYFATRNDLTILEAVRGLDAVVQGEPEVTIVELLRALKSGRPWFAEPGISLRSDGGPRRNPPRGLLDDLSVLPPAAPDLFHESRLRLGQKVLFNRGCNSDCGYCGLQVPYRSAFDGRTRFWRSRSSGEILREIEGYVAAFGVRRFVFNAFVLFGYDAAGSRILEEILQGLVARNLGIEFSFVSHPDKLLANRHLLPLMKEAGLRSIYLGIDSGLERALALYQVDFGLKEIFASLAALHEERIGFDVGLFFFDPYISFPEIRQHLQFVRTLRPWFGHMEKPFSFFLERQLLTSALRPNWGMPLCRKLEEDGLLVPTDPLERDPAVRFKDQAAGKLFALHQSVWRMEELKALRPFLWDRCRATAHGLELFPLRLAEELWEFLEKKPAVGLDSAIERVRSWVRSEVPWSANLEHLEALNPGGRG
jgi:anaerobic magnesium-protoporphyrin IX monomethyl ester cyclase